MTEPKVSIVIINWNGWKDTVECLESVFQNKYSNYNIVVIDNGSRDNSIEMIKRYMSGDLDTVSDLSMSSYVSKPIPYIEFTYDCFDTSFADVQVNEDSSLDKKLILVRSNTNYGFAEGNNVAINYAIRLFDPKYILLLNNDTIVDKSFLTELVKGITSKENVGIVGPKIYYYDYNGRRDVINYAGAKFWGLPGLAKHIGNGEVDVGQYDKISKTDYVNGAALLVDRNVINAIGLLKSHYFLYWEETDFCVRATKAGYCLYYIPSSKVWHKISQSTSKISGQITYYYTRNTFWFVRENSKRSEYIFFLICFFGLLIWFRLFEIVSHGGDYKSIVSFFKGITDGLNPISISADCQTQKYICDFKRG